MHRKKPGSILIWASNHPCFHFTFKCQGWWLSHVHKRMYDVTFLSSVFSLLDSLVINQSYEYCYVTDLKPYLYIRCVGWSAQKLFHPPWSEWCMRSDKCRFPHTHGSLTHPTRHLEQAITTHMRELQQQRSDDDVTGSILQRKEGFRSVVVVCPSPSIRPSVSVGAASCRCVIVVTLVRASSTAEIILSVTRAGFRWVLPLVETWCNV